MTTKSFHGRVVAEGKHMPPERAPGIVWWRRMGGVLVPSASIPILLITSIFLFCLCLIFSFFGCLCVCVILFVCVILNGLMRLIRWDLVFVCTFLLIFTGRLSALFLVRGAPVACMLHIDNESTYLMPKKNIRG